MIQIPTLFYSKKWRKAVKIKVQKHLSNPSLQDHVSWHRSKSGNTACGVACDTEFPSLLWKKCIFSFSFVNFESSSGQCSSTLKDWSRSFASCDTDCTCASLHCTCTYTCDINLVQILYLYLYSYVSSLLYLYLYRSPLVWHRLYGCLSPLCDSLWRRLSPFSLIFSPARWEFGLHGSHFLQIYVVLTFCIFIWIFVCLCIGLRFCICICMDLPFCDVSCALFSGTVHNSLITTSLCPW